MEQTESTLASGYRPVTPDPVLKLSTRIIKGTVEEEEKIVRNHEALVELISHLRSMGCVIVFTTGVWDFYHHGHGKYLRKAKNAGREHFPDADHIVLVVGVDTDELTRQRKGPKRPIVPEEERYITLAELGSVDIITPQYEANQLYKLIQHDVRVISTSTTDLPPDHGEMKRQCAHLVNLPPQAETSTTARIRTLIMDGRHDALERFSKRLHDLLEEMKNELATVE